MSDRLAHHAGRTESGTALHSDTSRSAAWRRSGARGAERRVADEVTLGRAFEGRRLLDV
ncbi:hypothetical protein [Streptomyces sannanensis]|uniref:hypothetical protein n=1 Tax=Streptomyces sannanensis TaxID=285536 RepID=UPI003CD0580B